jgi:hypothetical protein
MAALRVARKRQADLEMIAGEMHDCETVVKITETVKT